MPLRSDGASTERNGPVGRRKREEKLDIPIGLSRWAIERDMGKGLTLKEAIARQFERRTAKERMGVTVRKPRHSRSASHTPNGSNE